MDRTEKSDCKGCGHQDWLLNVVIEQPVNTIPTLGYTVRVKQATIGNH